VTGTVGQNVWTGIAATVEAAGDVIISAGVGQITWTTVQGGVNVVIIASVLLSVGRVHTAAGTAARPNTAAASSALTNSASVGSARVTSTESESDRPTKVTVSSRS
jgi:hypothetical protein